MANNTADVGAKGQTTAEMEDAVKPEMTLKEKIAAQRAKMAAKDAIRAAKAAAASIHNVAEMHQPCPAIPPHGADIVTPANLQSPKSPGVLNHNTVPETEIDEPRSFASFTTTEKPTEGGTIKDHRESDEAVIVQPLPGAFPCFGDVNEAIASETLATYTTLKHRNDVGQSLNPDPTTTSFAASMTDEAGASNSSQSRQNLTDTSSSHEAEDDEEDEEEHYFDFHFQCNSRIREHVKAARKHSDELKAAHIAKTNAQKESRKLIEAHKEELRLAEWKARIAQEEAEKKLQLVEKKCQLAEERQQLAEEKCRLAEEKQQRFFDMGHYNPIFKKGRCPTREIDDLLMEESDEYFEVRRRKARSTPLFTASSSRARRQNSEQNPKEKPEATIQDVPQFEKHYKVSEVEDNLGEEAVLSIQGAQSELPMTEQAQGNLDAQKMVEEVIESVEEPKNNVLMNEPENILLDVENITAETDKSVDSRQDVSAGNWEIKSAVPGSSVTNDTTKGQPEDADSTVATPPSLVVKLPKYSLQPRKQPKLLLLFFLLWTAMIFMLGGANSSFIHKTQDQATSTVSDITNRTSEVFKPVVSQIETADAYIDSVISGIAESAEEYVTSVLEDIWKIVKGTPPDDGKAPPPPEDEAPEPIDDKEHLLNTCANEDDGVPRLPHGPRWIPECHFSEEPVATALGERTHDQAEGASLSRVGKAFCGIRAKLASFGQIENSDTPEMGAARYTVIAIAAGKEINTAKDTTSVKSFMHSVSRAAAIIIAFAGEMC